jgi:hypothetical protein
MLGKYQQQQSSVSEKSSIMLILQSIPWISHLLGIGNLRIQRHKVLKMIKAGYLKIHLLNAGSKVVDAFVHVYHHPMSCKNIMMMTVVKDGSCGEIRNGGARDGKVGKYDNIEVGYRTTPTMLAQ